MPDHGGVDPNEVVVVDAVREEHGGFVYVGGPSADKQVRHHETKANRLASYLVATKAYRAVQEESWRDEQVMAKERTITSEARNLQVLRTKVETAEDPDLLNIRAEKTALASRLSLATMMLHDSPQARVDYRKISQGGVRAVVATTVSSETVSDAPRRKK